MLAGKGGDGLAGQLHQLQDVDAEVAGHDAVDLCHLRGGNGRKSGVGSRESGVNKGDGVMG